MGDWNQVCKNEEEVGAFIRMMHSEYTPWTVIDPPLIEKFPVTLDVKKVSEKRQILKIVVAK